MKKYTFILSLALLFVITAFTSITAGSDTGPPGKVIKEAPVSANVLIAVDNVIQHDVVNALEISPVEQDIIAADPIETPCYTISGFLPVEEEVIHWICDKAQTPTVDVKANYKPPLRL